MLRYLVLLLCALTALVALEELGLPVSPGAAGGAAAFATIFWLSRRTQISALPSVSPSDASDIEHRVR
ncbi:hypothetical protein QH494_03130 [Sphingomonas sp. AR_OL41]|uniref:hypothetical protein n=1 Tax=Sphingomonas sp. AR_OL41 TaxID=3042729 RepID=UPI00248122D5|nr:hypothetical protein [Sphingomonas sp. AR_OL41]MDH7971164.1 hypothetical protein [Sphingomonas sp. AR_OL41]